MIPLELRKQSLMLATPTKNPVATIESLAPGAWLYEMKWDGMRCLACVEDGKVTLTARSGSDMTARYPEIVARLAELYPSESRVLDGEVLCFDPSTGKPDFNRVQQRQAQSKPAAITMRMRTHPATFMAFDVLWFDGDDLRFTPLAGRQALLDVDSQRYGADTRVMRSVVFGDGAALWPFVIEQGMEGLIAKERQSLYRGRRDSAWLKLKNVHRLTAIVTGYEEGEGSRSTRIGALFVSLLDADGNLVPVGKVGTGLKDSDHAPLLHCLTRGEEFLIEVEYLDFHNSLRMPSYKGVRTDVTRADCTLDQIGA